MSNGLEVLGEGFTTANPELKRVGNDNLALATVTVAFNRSVKDGQGGYKREATFMNCQCWGKTAERLAQQVQKGTLVHVRGQVIQKNWEKDGQKRSSFVIGLDNFHVVVKQNGNGNGNAPANGPTNSNAGNSGAGDSSDKAPPASEPPQTQPESAGPPVNPASEEDLPF